jgi:hypothetical protein
VGVSFLIRVIHSRLFTQKRILERRALISKYDELWGNLMHSCQIPLY